MKCIKTVAKRSIGIRKLVELPLVPVYDGVGVVVCLTIHSSKQISQPRYFEHRKES